MPNIKDIRAALPQYADLSDNSLVDVVRSVYYPQLSRDVIAARLGVTPEVVPEKKGNRILARMGDYALTGAKAVMSVPELAVGLTDLATGGRVGKFLENEGGAVGFRPAEARRILDEQYSDEQKQAFKAVQDAEGIGGKLTAALQNPSVIAHSVLESVPSIGAGGVVARGALRMLPRMAPTVAGAVGEGVVTAGQNAEQVRQQTPGGLLTAEQSAVQAGSGALAGVLSLLGGRVARSLGARDVDTMVAGAAKNPVAAKGIVRRVLEGAASEGLLEELPQSVQEQVAQNYSLGKPLDEGVDQAAVLGALSGGVMGAGANVMPNKPAPVDAGPAPQPVVPPVSGPMGRAANATIDWEAVNVPKPVKAEPGLAEPAATSNGIDYTPDQRFEAKPIYPNGAAPAGQQYGTKQAADIALGEAGLMGTHEVQQVGPSLFEIRPAAAPSMRMVAPGIYDTGDQAPTAPAHTPMRMPSQALLNAGVDPLTGELPPPAPAPKPEVQPSPNPKPAAPGARATTVGPDDSQRAVFGSQQEALDYISEVRKQPRNGAIREVPVQLADGTWSLAKQGELGNPITEQPKTKAPAAPVLDGDLLHPELKRPWTTKPGAVKAAKQHPGYEPVRVDGGFALRKVAEPAQATLDKIEQPAAAPAATVAGAPAGAEGMSESRGDAAPDAPAFNMTGKDDKPATMTRMNPETGEIEEWPVGTPAQQVATELTRPLAEEMTAPKADTVDAAAHEAAPSPQNDRPEPTQAQKEAGNYKKGHDSINGLPISFENPAGSVRRGVDKDGKPWENTLQHHYGYFKGTIGNDKDHVDVFVKPETPRDFAGTVFVVDQVHPDTKKFDEHKALLGFDTIDEAKAAYRSNYAKDWRGMQAISAMPFAEFKTWLYDGAKNKPLVPIAPARFQKKDTTDATPAAGGQPAAPEAARGEAPAPAARDAGATGEAGVPAARPAAVQADGVNDGAWWDTGDKAARLDALKAAGWGFGKAGPSVNAAQTAAKAWGKLTDSQRSRLMAGNPGQQTASDGVSEAAAEKPPVAELAAEPTVQPEAQGESDAKPADDVAAPADVVAGTADESAPDAGTGQPDVGSVAADTTEPVATSTSEPVANDAVVAPAAGRAEPDSALKPEVVRESRTTDKKIDDFGEKLTGARKDYAATLKDAESLDIAAEPLSKSWPEPNYEKLLESGVDPFVVAWVHASRDEVPTKPQSSWKLKGWVNSVEVLRGTSQKLLDGKIQREWLEAKIGLPEFVRLRQQVGSRAELYEMLGHGRSLKGISFGEHHFNLYRGQENVTKWIVEQKAKATAFSNWPRELAVADTKAEMLDLFKQKIDSLDLSKKAKGTTTFDIYRTRGKPGAIIGKKIGREYIDLKHMDDVPSARKYLADNVAELEKALEQYKQTPFERNSENQPRVGDDHRNGAPVTPEVFSQTFGFRGVQFGNYVEQDRRQSDLNQAFDALMDMAALLGVPPRALSLNGRLGLAFGARGKGGKNAPAAHYEPGNVVINMTKSGGPGTLAHEWWHALDNYFAKEFGEGGFVTDGVNADRLREAMKQSFDAVRTATQAPKLRQRAAELDKRRSKPYWNTPLELSARAFESYIIAKLNDQGAANDYLANVVDEKVWNVAESGRAEIMGKEPVESYPYPGQAELPAVRVAFDEFFKTVQTRQDEDGNVAMFSRGASEGDTAEKNALQALADTDALFALPKSQATTVEGIAADNDPGISVKAVTNIPGETRYNFTLPSGKTARMMVRNANKYGSPTYGFDLRDGVMSDVLTERPGDNPEDVDPDKGDVWIDVSLLESGDEGRTVYNIASTYAHNTGRIFIGDPAGLSDEAMIRRPELMLSSALKFGTTEHLAPHPRQVSGDKTLGVPPLKWVYGDDIGNIKRLIDLNLKVQENHGNTEITYDPATGQFKDSAGQPIDRAGLAELAKAGYGRSALAGGATHARSAVLAALLREEGSQVQGADRGRDGLLGAVVRQSAVHPDSTDDLFYSKPGLGVAEPTRRSIAIDTGMAPEAIAAEVERLTERWDNAPEVVVVSSMADAKIPERVRQEDESQHSQGATGNPEGFFYGGKVYLVASELPTAADVRRVLFHESLGHFGLRGLYGKGLADILDQVLAARPAEVKRKAREYGLNWDNRSDRRVAAEEVLAELAQTRPEIGFVRRAIAAVRAWLRGHGFGKLALSDDEIITQFILPARAFVTRGQEQAMEAVPAFSRDAGPDKVVHAATDTKRFQNLKWEPNTDDMMTAKLPNGWTANIVSNDDEGTVELSVLDPRGLDFGAPVTYQDMGTAMLAAPAVMAKRITTDMVQPGDPWPQPASAKKASTPAKPLTESQFYRTYSQHIDIRGRQDGTADGNIERIKSRGFQTGNVNTMPAYRGGKPLDIMARRFMPKAGDVVYLVPNEWTRDTGNGRAIKDGWKPKDFEVVKVTTDGPSMYQEYLKGFGGGGDGPMFSRAKPDQVFDVKQAMAATGNTAAHYRGMAMQALGRRQIVDLWAKDVPQLAVYSDLVQRMDAEKNDSAAEADAVATAWAKLKDEKALAELMHDATLAQIDPAKAYVPGDSEPDYKRLRAAWESLSPEAQGVYIQSRDMYVQHYAKVKAAITERLERSQMASDKRKLLLERMESDFFKSTKGVYFPLARFGKYVVLVRDAGGKVVSVTRGETLNEAQTIRAELVKQFPADQGFEVGKVLKDKERLSSMDGPGKAFMDDLFETLDMKGASDDVKDAVGQLYLEALPDLSWAKHGIHRKGTPGFSQDARRAYAQAMFHGARYLAKLRYADRLAEQLTGMQEHVDGKANDAGFDSVKAQQVVDEMGKRHEMLMNPATNPLSTALTSMGFVFHLGLSPASAMVNLLQTATTAYPVMGAKWGYDKSATALMKASREAIAGGNDIGKGLKGDELKAYEQAVSTGVIDVTMAHDLAGVAQGEDAKVSWTLRPVMKAASFMFHHAEKFNRSITFMAAYRLAREAGAAHSVAFEQAVDATYKGHFDYSASNRPRIMAGNWAKVLLLFKQFGQNMVYLLARQAHQALKGATPAERTEARKALAGLLVSHAMAAGALGLPLVGTLLAAASWLGGSDDEPWDAEAALRNTLAETFGTQAADVMAHGLSRLTPWDISGRIGLNTMILPDLQEGLQGRDAWKSILEAGAGPVAAIVGGSLEGMKLMSEGKFLFGLEAMLPAALRGPVKSIRYAQDGAQDKTGIPILDEVSGLGIAGQVLGLSPSDVRLATEGRSAIYRADKALASRRTTLLAMAAKAQMAGDDEGLAELKAQIKAFNEKNPDRRISPQNLRQAVATRRRRIEQADQGVYLPKNRQGVMPAGDFAVTD